MLGRNVENINEEKGISFPFEKVSHMLKEPSITFGNFEGIVSEEHTQTPSMGFQFSIKREYLAELKNIGFDVLSLANNHSFDYGMPALHFTRDACDVLGLVCGGTPSDIDAYTAKFIIAGSKKIAILFIEAVWKEPDMETLLPLLEEINADTDMQIVYIHWGTEYELVHNLFQENLAHTLIDRGVDVIIGHHPHVVQDVALYNGKPIFYSLGNFVFDQYFSRDVEEGLTVSMNIGTSTTYSLVPVTSGASRSQPSMMDLEQKTELLERVLLNIKNEEGVNVAEGTVTILH
jgi:poly-gamma-glutamate synthesis protein (capsule biosynthesis protein)